MQSRDALMAALDCDRPDWPIAFATQQELKDFAVAVRRDRPNATAYATESLKRNVAARLFEVIRTAVHHGLVEPKEGF